MGEIGFHVFFLKLFPVLNLCPSSSKTSTNIHRSGRARVRPSYAQHHNYILYGLDAIGCSTIACWVDIDNRGRIKT